MSRGTRAAIGAWLITALYYFYQYTLRSAPAVMMPQLSDAFGLSAMGMASMVGLFYYGYSPFSLVAGVAMDRLGPRRIVPLGAAAVGAGALLFASGIAGAASIGRLLQGAGGVFALVGAVYIATTNFPASRAATLIGATQMFGMAGGSAGQFLVGPLIAAGVSWRVFWAVMGIVGLAISAVLAMLLPDARPARRATNWLRPAGEALVKVVSQPAVDPVRGDCRPAIHPDDDLRHDLGRPLPAGRPRVRLWRRGDAVGDRSARMDHRLPAARSDLRPDRPPPRGHHRGRRGSVRVRRVDSVRQHGAASSVLVGLFAGHRQRRGDAAVYGDQGSQSAGRQRHRDRGRQFPELHLQRAARSGVQLTADHGQRRHASLTAEHYQTAFQPLLYGVALAIVLTFFLKETGGRGAQAVARSHLMSTNDRNRQVRTTPDAVPRARAGPDRRGAPVRGGPRWRARSRRAR